MGGPREKRRSRQTKTIVTSETWYNVFTDLITTRNKQIGMVLHSRSFTSVKIDKTNNYIRLVDLYHDLVLFE